MKLEEVYFRDYEIPLIKPFICIKFYSCALKQHIKAYALVSKSKEL